MLGNCFSYCLSIHCSRKLDLNQSSEDSIEPDLCALVGCFNCPIKLYIYFI